MIITTTETVPNKEVEEVLGVVTGNIVQSKHIGRDVMAGLKTIVGGEIRGYTEMLTESRNIAIERITAAAQEKGADAVVGMRFTTSSVMERSAEIMVFGTAVKLKDKE
ncbi:heavy metal-binding domain-containing protein [Shewanella sp. 202IG2-18]|uniref:heavy metal-binding domain-containing protein n=1 Tax=Parashewanella hymeniacidonis TaxID=2807618 RepID=UPI001961414F|nr:heavy metal-binding domain-containing protein [Parashewanella hymeniacidonis]MBM7072907.1 heavy metal-binding domain-containing protein [Parashewanella hymeniacidonis]